MPSLYEFEFASATATGLVRARNEDTVAVRAAQRLALVADGMGGYAAGEVASGIAATIVTQTVEKRLQRRDWRRTPHAGAMQQLLRSAVALANRAILATAQRQPHYAGMGTTLVAALFHHQRVCIAHIGDSRAYRWRGGHLQQLTHDHSWLQEQIDAGLISSADARFAPNKNLVTRALGMQPQIDIEIHEHALADADTYLLCSDGLTDMLTDPEIAAVLANAASLQQTAAQLIARANAQGGRDNISAILINVKRARHDTSELLGHLTNWIK